MVSSFSSYFVPIFLLVLLPIIALGHDDVWPPFYDKVCDEVNCGHGKCVTSSSFPFSYFCECDAGWKRTADDDDELTFLPCVIPNCSLDYAPCQPAPQQVREKEVPRNISCYDPCNWIYCGEGTCTRTKTYTHTCTCKPGYFNLLNVSFYPCYSQCTLGADCSNLGISILSSKEKSSNTPGEAADIKSHGNLILPGKHIWVIIMLLLPW